MSGFDPEAIFDAIAALFDPDEFGLDGVYPFAPKAPLFPALGLFPASDFIDYWGAYGENRPGILRLEIRTAFTFDAEDSMRALFRLLASGSGHDRSIVDRLNANRKLGGLVNDVKPGVVTVRAGGDENAGFYEAVIAVDVVMKRT